MSREGHHLSNNSILIVEQQQRRLDWLIAEVEGCDDQPLANREEVSGATVHANGSFRSSERIRLNSRRSVDGPNVNELPVDNARRIHDLFADFDTTDVLGIRVGDSSVMELSFE